MYIVFPTPEIPPFINGGIGQYILQIVQYLQSSIYTPLLILYSIPQSKTEQVRQHLKTLNVRCELYHVNELSKTKLNSEDVYNIKKTSSALAESLQAIINNKNVVGVEWCEHCGMGFHTLRDKHTNTNSVFRNIPMWVHLHGAREICDLADRYPVSLDKSSEYLLSNYTERFCLEIADAWKSPSKSVADWYNKYFGIYNEVVVSPLPYRKLAEKNFHHQIEHSKFPLKILCPGRIAHLKGTDIIAQACVEICKNFPGKIHVTFAGYNLPTVNTKYATYLDEIKSFIPKEYIKYFSFTGKYSAEEYLQLAQDSHFAVFASRVENFCLAAHELNWIGMPLVLADIPAFKEHFQHNTNCYKFDGSVEGLIAILTQIIESPEMVTKLDHQVVSDFDIKVFDHLINLPQISKVNSNYFLFTKMIQIYLEPENLESKKFKSLCIFSLHDLTLALLWKIVKRIADIFSMPTQSRVYFKGLLKNISLLK